MKTKNLAQIIIVILVGVSIPGYIVWKNIFPDFTYYLTEDVKFGVRIFKKTAGEKDYLTLPQLENYFFDKASILVETGKKIDKEVQVKAYKGYQALYFPEGEAIKSREEFLQVMNSNPVEMPNGGLFSYNDSVNVLSGDVYYPVFSSQVFDKMGYSWDDVQERGGDFAGKLTKGERLIYGSAHPGGTIFEDQEGGYFLVWDKRKRKLAFPEAEKALESGKYAVIQTQPENFRELGACSVKVSGDSFECQFRKKETLKGLDYVFNARGVELNNISEAEVKLSATPSVKNFKQNTRIFYRKLKTDILERYGDYLF